MTNENSHEEETSEPEPHAMMDDDGELWFRDESGKWEKMERVSTGDPELDELWEMSVDEVEAIAKNEDHPLHEKAAQVQYEAFAPFREISENLTNRWSNLVGPSLFQFPLALKADFLWSNFAPTLGKDLGKQFADSWRWDLDTKGLVLKRNEENGEQADEIPSDFLEHSAGPSYDIDDFFEEESDPEPLLVSVAALNRTGKAMLETLDEANDQRAKMREENLKASQEASMWAKKANNWARKANSKAKATITLSSVAIAIAVASLLVAIFDWGVA